ncbi:hypothetical protein SGPA1_50161 [Streptomyces misionensis JCM 4497]
MCPATPHRPPPPSSTRHGPRPGPGLALPMQLPGTRACLRPGSAEWPGGRASLGRCRPAPGARSGRVASCSGCPPGRCCALSAWGPPERGGDRSGSGPWPPARAARRRRAALIQTRRPSPLSSKFPVPPSGFWSAPAPQTVIHNATEPDQGETDPMQKGRPSSRDTPCDLRVNGLCGGGGI